jgi:hypothetical protein
MYGSLWAVFILRTLQILFCSCFTYRGQSGLIGPLLNSHPVALKHLMRALTYFYIGSSEKHLFAVMAILIYEVRG